jgi:hypothetical protein
VCDDCVDVLMTVCVMTVCVMTVCGDCVDDCVDDCVW